MKGKKIVSAGDLAQEAYNQLENLVTMRWWDAAPRVRAWEDTLVTAFEYHFIGAPETLVELPEGAFGPSGETADTAANILDSFNEWLGRNAVVDVIDWVEEEVEG